MQWGALFGVTEGCGTRLSTRTLGGCSLQLSEPICLWVTCGCSRPHPFDGQWQGTGPQAPCNLWSTLFSRVNSWEPRCIGIRNSVSWGETHSNNYRPTAALQNVLSTDKNHLTDFLSRWRKGGITTSPSARPGFTSLSPAACFTVPSFSTLLSHYILSLSFHSLHCSSAVVGEGWLFSEFFPVSPPIRSAFRQQIQTWC